MANTDVDFEDVAAVTDPGEVGREEHNWGDRAVVFLSNIAAWLFPALMVAICAQVILRNAGVNQAWLDDLQWWLYGAAVLMGVGYAVTTDSHVRVDVLYDNYPDEKKNRISIFAIGWLFLPFVILAWDTSAPYAVTSYIADEGSSSPNGLHNLWIIKVFMNLSFLFIAFASVAALVRLIKRRCKPTLSRVMLNALPATIFAVNLVVYYTAWVIVWAGAEAEATTRDIGRHWFFDDFEWGVYDIKYTFVATAIVSILVIGLARIIDRRARAEG